MPAQNEPEVWIPRGYLLGACEHAQTRRPEWSLGTERRQSQWMRQPAEVRGLLSPAQGLIGSH